MRCLVASASRAIITRRPTAPSLPSSGVLGGLADTATITFLREHQQHSHSRARVRITREDASRPVCLSLRQSGETLKEVDGDARRVVARDDTVASLDKYSRCSVGAQDSPRGSHTTCLLERAPRHAP